MTHQLNHIVLSAYSHSLSLFGLKLTEKLINSGNLVSLILSQSAINAAQRELKLHIDVQSTTTAHESLKDALELSSSHAKLLSVYFDDEPYSLKLSDIEDASKFIICPADIFALSAATQVQDVSLTSRLATTFLQEGKDVSLYLAEKRFDTTLVNLLQKALERKIHLRNLALDKPHLSSSMEVFLDSYIQEICEEILA
ncbi:MAG: hypothetical protein Q4E22_04895 [Coriobacteriia bacterium]|nr:hypothetical protein [Coriobacteriia bacterium]